MRVLILGAGGHGQVIADCLAMQVEHGTDVTVGGFLDDKPELKRTIIMGIKVLGPISALAEIEHDGVVVGIGDNRVRSRIFNELRARGELFPTIVHPSAVVARDVSIGLGTVVFPGAVINTGTVVGANTIINTGATIDHHGKIGDHVHIAPGVHLGGSVTVSGGAFLGIGSCVLPNLTIAEWSVVGAGAAVIRDVPVNTRVAGVPAKELGPTR